MFLKSLNVNERTQRDPESGASSSIVEDVSRTRCLVLAWSPHMRGCDRSISAGVNSESSRNPDQTEHLKTPGAPVGPGVKVSNLTVSYFSSVNKGKLTV